MIEVKIIQNGWVHPKLGKAWEGQVCEITQEMFNPDFHVKLTTKKDDNKKGASGKTRRSKTKSS